MAVTTRQAQEPGHDTAIARDLPAIPRSVGAARAAVADLARRHGASAQALDDIRLAVSEAATNVVMHAYRTDVPGRLRLMAVVGGDELLVVVEDDGCGPRTGADSPGLGMGLKVMAMTSEQMQFLPREVGGTTVQLCFALQN
jgi:serine/threonine-protein kinase RsbW